MQLRTRALRSWFQPFLMMGDLAEFQAGGDEKAASCQPFDLNENILGSVDEGIRTRRQIASVRTPSCPVAPPTQTAGPSLNPTQTPVQTTPKPLSSDQVACHLNATFPGRAPQIDEFLSALGNAGESSPPVLVWGGPATGKTSIIRGALRLLGRPHAYISCRSSGSSRMLFEAVIDQLAGHVRSSANNYTSHRRCTDLNDFVLSLPPVCAAAAAGNPKPHPGRPKLPNPAQNPNRPSRQSTMDRFPTLATTNFVLVFDHAELLRTEDTSSAASALLPVLSRLPELTGVSTLSVVLVSSVAWDAFETGTGGPTPNAVHFPDYSAEQLQAILSRGRPPLYPAFLKMVLPPATRINRMLTELNELLEPLFRKYLEPIERGHVERSQAATDAGGRRLYSSLLPHLKAAMADDVSIVRAAGGASGKGSADGPGFEMSGECRFLLLASYIASRNPAAMDSAYLADEDDARKAKRRRKSGAVSEQVRRDVEVQEEHLRGPLSFPLERLSAIFHCIAGDYLHPSTAQEPGNGVDIGGRDPGVVHRQLLTLLGVGLVSRTGGDPIEGGAKYRCNADEELAQKVARSVKFPLASYLLHG